MGREMSVGFAFLNPCQSTSPLSSTSSLDSRRTNAPDEVFGPTGVAENARGGGIGKSLLLACLCGLREMGYVYGIIGGAGPVEFYENSRRDRHS